MVKIKEIFEGDVIPFKPRQPAVSDQEKYDLAVKSQQQHKKKASKKNWPKKSGDPNTFWDEFNDLDDLDEVDEGDVVQFGPRRRRRNMPDKEKYDWAVKQQSGKAPPSPDVDYQDEAPDWYDALLKRAKEEIPTFDAEMRAGHTKHFVQKDDKQKKFFVKVKHKGGEVEQITWHKWYDNALLHAYTFEQGYPEDVFLELVDRLS